MKKVLTLAAAIAAAASFLAIGGTAGANNAAIIINDQGCGLWDGDGNVVFADSDHAVINKSGGAMICKISGVPNSSGKAVHYDINDNPAGPGTQCVLPVNHFTDKWSETVSASGNATFRCNFK